MIEPAAICRSIAGRDAKALTKLPQIGARMAETIIAELSGKVDGFLTSQEIEALDAVAALIALGQTRQEAEVQVTRAVGRLGNPASVQEIWERVLGGGVPPRHAGLW